LGANAPSFRRTGRPGFDSLDYSLAFRPDRTRLGGREQSDLDGFREMVFVFPAPASVGVDPDVEQMVGRVEAERPLATAPRGSRTSP
jgi:hypothetical protein